MRNDGAGEAKRPTVLKCLSKRLKFLLKTFPFISRTFFRDNLAERRRRKIFTQKEIPKKILRTDFYRRNLNRFALKHFVYKKS